MCIFWGLLHALRGEVGLSLTVFSLELESKMLQGSTRQQNITDVSCSSHFVLILEALLACLLMSCRRQKSIYISNALHV